MTEEKIRKSFFPAHWDSGSEDACKVLSGEQLDTVGLAEGESVKAGCL